MTTSDPGIITTFEPLTREQAARLLAKAEEVFAQAELTDALLSELADWEHPQAAEQGAQARNDRDWIIRRLERRAYPASRPPTLRVGFGS